MIIFARRPIIAREGVLAAVWWTGWICVMKAGLPSHMVIPGKSLAPSPLQSAEAPRHATLTHSFSTDFWVLERVSFLGNHLKTTGLNVLAKNRGNCHDWAKSQTRFQTFLRGKSVLFTWKCQIREFHAYEMERGEVFKRYCGWQKEATALKQTPKDKTFIHAAGALQ